MKVLVYSMYQKPGIISVALEAGADGFVHKHAPESELVFALEQILGGNTYVQPSLVPPVCAYRNLFDGLTRQEQIILKLFIEGKSDAQIAKERNIVARSLENHLSRIYKKTGCKNRAEFIQKFCPENESPRVKKRHRLRHTDSPNPQTFFLTNNRNLSIMNKNHTDEQRRSFDLREKFPKWNERLFLFKMRGSK